MQGVYSKQMIPLLTLLNMQDTINIIFYVYLFSVMNSKLSETFVSIFVSPISVYNLTKINIYKKKYQYKKKLQKRNENDDLYWVPYHFFLDTSNVEFHL